MSRPTDTEIVQAACVFARLIAHEQLTATREADSEWIDLATLSLGRKRGPDMCRRWLAAGKTGVLHLGRSWRLHRSVLDEFLGQAPAPKPKNTGVLDRIERKLALVGGGR